MIKVNDLVKVIDWSYNLNCNNESFNHIKYMPYYGDGKINFNYIGSDIFRVIEYGVYPTDYSIYNLNIISKMPETNNVMIENVLTKEILFINKKFIRKA